MTTLIQSIRKRLAAWLYPSGFQNYVANELSHFVGRGKAPAEQFDLLIHIIETGLISHPPHNPNISGNLTVTNVHPFSSNDMYCPEMVCFCDIPVDQLSIHCSKYSRFGVSFSKRFLADRGARPVFYVPRDGKVRSIRRPDDLTKIVCASQSRGLDSLTILEETGTYFDKNVRVLTGLVANGTGGPGVTPITKFVDFDLLSYFKFFDVHLVQTAIKTTSISNGSGGLSEMYSSKRAMSFELLFLKDTDVSFSQNFLIYTSDLTLSGMATML